MKRYIIHVTVAIIFLIVLNYLYYYKGWYIDFNPKQEITTFTKTDNERIYLKKGSEYEAFEIRGVNLGSGIPGKWSTDFAIDKETYLRWFSYMKEMGANTVRIYTIQNEDFYEAFYEFNLNNDDPLYMLQGVWVNDYIQNSYRDAYAKEFYDTFLHHCKIAVDVIHGHRKLMQGDVLSAGHGTYKKDVSPWVIGYILGVEWEDVTVAYTDEKYKRIKDYSSYQGTYMVTTEDASPFEVMLAKVGDQVIEYESVRYKTHRLIAFSNWPTTDPFTYPEDITNYFMKCAQVDVQHIKTTDRFLSGHFASYHVYPYYPDYLSYIADWSTYLPEGKDAYMEDGALNTYRAYLHMLTSYHDIPVVISEYGVSTGRGMAQRDSNTGRNQGHMSEAEQGHALIQCYIDIMESGCAGSCLFTWQDEWFKRTWNTMYSVNLKRTPFWSDYQTNEQYFGLLSFDPGKETSVCYVDGDISEWTGEKPVLQQNEMSLYMKYDEKFVYFMIHKENLQFGKEVLYIPIDTTQKSGSSYCSNEGILFDRAVDFLIAIKGMYDSRITVQERYEVLRSNYSWNVDHFNTYITGNIPDVDSPLFVPINMILQTATPLIYADLTQTAEVYETGLLAYGNANPDSEDYYSLADFIVNGDYIELKLPWQILNFADPSQMEIHDDYYDGNYGVDYIAIDKMYVGLGTSNDNGRISLQPFALKGWDYRVTYHERLKPSYYILKNYWANRE